LAIIAWTKMLLVLQAAIIIAESKRVWTGIMEAVMMKSES
jgi:hypothetical protein